MSSYITLISDASTGFFPQNRIGCFRAKLPRTLTFDKNRFQIGLTFISWPNNLYNLTDGTFKVKGIFPPQDLMDVHTSDGVVTLIGAIDPVVESMTLQVAPGHYQDVTELVNAMNDKLTASRFTSAEFRNYSSCAKYYQFQFNKTTELCSFVMAPVPTRADDPKIEVELSEELNVKLGFGVSGPAVLRADQKAPHTADLNLRQNAMFVYCDVLESNRILGNQISNLLTIIPQTGEHGRSAYFEPNSTAYCDLRYDSFDEIEISLRDDAGEVLGFNSGKVIITLHIKQRF